MASIDTIEGIGAKYATKLRTARLDCKDCQAVNERQVRTGT